MRVHAYTRITQQFGEHDPNDSPTRTDLIVAVYRHQVEACAEAGALLLADVDSPLDALRQRIDLFIDFNPSRR